MVASAGPLCYGMTKILSYSQSAQWPRQRQRWRSALVLSWISTDWDNATKDAVSCAGICL
ncbi:hypothetical protein IG631_22581 [Alternaria alternata]|nr:hypothetical protein IG631_22581 [Alternaria alternata]